MSNVNPVESSPTVPTRPPEDLPDSIAVGGSAGIAAQLRRAILGGSYGFNERLPSERYLAEHFGASRGTIREALRRLKEMNLVSRQVGSGTFVTYREMSGQMEIADVTSPLELIDVRFGIEPQMVRLAVANATLVDIERLRRALEVSTGDRIIKVSVVGIVFSDSFWSQDLVSHCAPLSVASNFIDQLVEPDDQAVCLAFCQSQMKVTVGQGERRWVVCRTFDLL